MSVVRKGPKATAVRVGTYVILSVVAAIVIFPFLVALSTAFKEPKDVFTYPPSLIPRSEATGTVEGVDGEVALYTFPDQDGTFGLVENGVSLGVFVDPADPGGETVTAALDSAEKTDQTVSIDGEERPVYVVDVAGEELELARIRTATGALFQKTDDPTVQVAGLVNEATSAREFSPRFENFNEVLDRQRLDRSLSNTFLVTLLVVGGQLVTSIMGGYAFARIKFKGRDSLFLVYLGSVMIPFVVLIIPLYQLMVQLRWVNNLSALVVPFVFTAYGTFLMRQFFLAIPAEIEEAAMLDGASRGRILWRIFVPLAKPAIATLGTFAFLYAWNSFVWPLVIINSGSTDNFVLSLSLQQLGGQASDKINLVFAGIVIAMLPPIIVFLLAQRTYVENAAGAGMK